MNSTTYRQIVYTSRATGEVDTGTILETSRHNNALDGVSGVLWFDGTTFVQVLEGPDHSVAATFVRIAADDRHQEVDVLSDRIVSEREFGYWSMELATARDASAWARLSRRIGKLPVELQGHFAN